MLCLWLVILSCGSLAWCNVIAAQRTLSWISKLSAFEALQNFENYVAYCVEQNSTDPDYDFCEYLQEFEIAHQIQFTTENILNYQELPDSVHMFWNDEDNQGVSSFGMTSSEVRHSCQNTISHNAVRTHLCMLVIWREKHHCNLNTANIRKTSPMYQ